MHIKLILCPLDEFADGDSINAVASALAATLGANLIYLHVSEPVAPYGSGYAYVDTIHESEEDLEFLKRFTPAESSGTKSTAAETEVNYSHHVKLGMPADVILQFARDQHVDLIVMGTHGRAGVNRVVMGSVAEAVMRRAPCPVLTIRLPAEVAAG